MTARALVAALRGRGWHVTTAESCTGGLLAGAITDTPGASAVFGQGVVTYSNQAKIDMLGVKAATLERHGAVSEPVAAEMAQGAQARAGAEIGVAVTGIAGPGGSEAKPEGRVCFAVSARNETRSETVDFGPLGRARVRAASVAHALDMVLATLD